MPLRTLPCKHAGRRAARAAQLLAREPPALVVAGARAPAAAPELLALQAQHGRARLTLVQLDLASEGSIEVRAAWHTRRRLRGLLLLLSGPHGAQEAAREVARACPGGVDVLLNVAGALGSLDLASQTCGLSAPGFELRTRSPVAPVRVPPGCARRTSDDLEAVLRVNVIGAHPRAPVPPCSHVLGRPGRPGSCPCLRSARRPCADRRRPVHAGTLALTRALLPLLRAGARKTVVNLSSGAGSIAARGGQGAWGPRSLAYKASKAALNMGARGPASQTRNVHTIACNRVESCMRMVHGCCCISRSSHRGRAGKHGLHATRQARALGAASALACAASVIACWRTRLPREHAAEPQRAAPRAATVLLARELQPEGFTVVPITPGWVATDLGNSTAELAGPGGPRPALDAAASVRHMLAVLDGLTPEDSGTFFNYDGGRLVW